MPFLLPWLAIVLLLAAKDNRAPQAWLIFVPLVVVTLLSGAEPLTDFLPAQLREASRETLRVLGFGYAALWLVTPLVRPRHGFVTFLASLVTVGLFSAFVLLVRLLADGGSVQDVFLGVLLLACIVAGCLAANLASLFCRKAYSGWRYLGAVTGVDLAISLLFMVPFIVIAWIGNEGRVGVVPVLGMLFVLLFGASLVPLVAFVALSTINGFYRGRLKEFFRIGERAAPPVIVGEAAAQEVAIH